MGAAQSNVLYRNDTIIINNITYTVLKKSGEGSYGKVYSVKRNSDGIKFIVKIVVNDYYGKNELDIMKFLSYYPKCAPYIVCLQDYGFITSGGAFWARFRATTRRSLNS